MRWSGSARVHRNALATSHSTPEVRERLLAVSAATLG